MKANQIREAVCMLANSCSLTLVKHQLHPNNTSQVGYLQASSRDEEAKIAQCFTMYFHKAWYQTPQDFEGMSIIYERQFKGSDLNQEELMNALIRVSMDMEDPDDWDDCLYPKMFFPNNDYTKPHHIEIKFGDPNKPTEE